MEWERVDEKAAEASYQEAIRIADEQGSMLHKLTATVSLAKLLQSQARVEPAKEKLAPVVDWFAEQRVVPLIKDAQELLASM